MHRGTGGRHQTQAGIGERAGDPNRRGLVAIVHREIHRALRRKTVRRRELTLGIGDTERSVDSHHLSGRAHLRAEHRIDLGETTERKHRLFHADVPAGFRRPQESFDSELGERCPDHHATRHHRQGHARGFGHERHGSRRTWVRFEHVDHAVANRELDVDKSAYVEGVSDRPGESLQLGDGKRT